MSREPCRDRSRRLRHHRTVQHEIAALCGVHHSTLQTRLDAISEIVGFDPLDGLGRTRLGIAYLVWRLRHSHVLDLPAPTAGESYHEAG